MEGTSLREQRINKNKDIIYQVGWVCEEKYRKVSVRRSTSDWGVTWKKGVCLIWSEDILLSERGEKVVSGRTITHAHVLSACYVWETGVSVLMKEWVMGRVRAKSGSGG